MRRIDKDGNLLANDLSRKEQDLLQAIPGYSPKTRKISLNLGDRKRVLDLAERLDFDVDASLYKYKYTKESEAARSLGLYDYQIEGVHFLSSKDRAILADDMGTGKSPQSIRSFPEGEAILVVCPACLKYNWQDEFHKWHPTYQTTVINGRDKFQWPKQGEAVIVNYDILPEYLEPVKDQDNKYKEYLDVPQFMKDIAKNVRLVVDECHKIRNGKTKQSSKVRSLQKMCKSVWGLTGTPLLNRPSDLWGVLYNLGMAHEVFGSFQKFKELFNARKNKWGGLVYGKPDPLAPELLRKVMLRRKRTSVLPNLPRKTRTEIKVDRIPRDLKKDLDEAFGKWGPLLLLDEMPDFTAFSGLRKALALSRIEMMTEYVELCEEQNVPLLVFSAHREPILSLAKREGWDVILGDTSPKRRQDIVRKFQAGEIKNGVGLTIGAGGVGLTLTRAWKALFIDKDWVPANNCQAEDRICRIGQNSDKVEIVSMITDHPLDIHTDKLIKKKMEMFELSVEKEFRGSSDKNLTPEIMAKINAELENGVIDGGVASAKISYIKGTLYDRVNKRKKLRYEFAEDMTEQTTIAFNDMYDSKRFDDSHRTLAEYIKKAGFPAHRDALECAYLLLVSYPDLKARFPSLFRKQKREEETA